MARDRSEGPVTGRADVLDRIAAARTVVYDDSGDLIEPGEIEDALREVGVVVSENEDGTTAYSDVPPELPLSACHLAVDLREDPASFIARGE